MRCCCVNGYRCPFYSNDGYPLCLFCRTQWQCVRAFYETEPTHTEIDAEMLAYLRWLGYA